MKASSLTLTPAATSAAEPTSTVCGVDHDQGGLEQTRGDGKEPQPEGSPELPGQPGRGGG